MLQAHNATQAATVVARACRHAAVFARFIRGIVGPVYQEWLGAVTPGSQIIAPPRACRLTCVWPFKRGPTKGRTFPGAFASDSYAWVIRVMAAKSGWKTVLRFI